MPYKDPKKAKIYAREWAKKFRKENPKKSVEIVMKSYYKMKEDPQRYKKFQAHKQRYNKRYYKVNAEVFKQRTKIHNNQTRFGGHRDQVLERNQYKCQICSSNKRVLIHHKDGEGRGKQTPNNDITNLITLCYICHLSIHQYSRIKNIPLTKELLDKLP